MRRSITVAAALSLVAVAAGCGPAGAQAEQHFKDLLLVHFSSMNDEAERMKMDSKVPRTSPEQLPSLGQQFNTFTWHPDGVILEDVECPGCRTRHTIVAYRGDFMNCPSCGSLGRDGKEGAPLVPANKTPRDLEALFPGKVKPMFEDKGKHKGDAVAIVRYVRRHWTLDPTARVQSTALDRGTSTRPEVIMARDNLAKHTSGSSYYAGSFHRVDATFVGTAAFLYDGKLHRFDKATLQKLVEGGAVDAKASFGGSAAIEKPVRMWAAPVKPGSR